MSAYDDLCAAVRTYYDKVEPDSYVEAWCLITHRLSPELEQDGQSTVGVLSSPEMSWVMKRGLLDVALTEDRQSATVPEDDDD
jgi:hypothetical protein